MSHAAVTAVADAAPRFTHAAEEASGDRSNSQHNTKKLLCATSSNRGAPGLHVTLGAQASMHPQTAADRCCAGGRDAT
jgi:hypothetical protein